MTCVECDRCPTVMDNKGLMMTASSLLQQELFISRREGRIVRAQRKIQRPIHMLVISTSYQNYQNVVVGNQLMNVGKGVGWKYEGVTDSESVDLLRVQTVEYTPYCSQDVTLKNTTKPILLSDFLWAKSVEESVAGGRGGRGGGAGVKSRGERD